MSAAAPIVVGVVAAIGSLAPPELEVPEAGETTTVDGPAAGDHPAIERSAEAYADELEPLPEAERDEVLAKRKMSAAKAAFRDGAYEQAIELLASAYRTYPYVTLLYSLGSAHRRAYEDGDDIEHRRLAIRRYQQYLTAAPDAEYADRAQNYLTALLAERDLGDIEAEVVTRLLISTTAERASLRIDGSEPIEAPGVTPIAPGEHEIVVSAPGYRDLVREIDVPEGTTYQIQAELEDEPGTIEIAGPKGAWVRLDGRLIGQLPLAETLRAEPGQHVLSVSKNGRDSFSKDLELARAGHVKIDAQLDVSNRRYASYFLMGIGAAGLTAAGVLTGLTIARQRQALELSDRRDEDQLTVVELERYNELVDQRNNLRAATVLTGLGSGVLFVTGVVLFVYDTPALAGGRPLAGVRVSPALGPNFTGLTGSLRF